MMESIREYILNTKFQTDEIKVENVQEMVRIMKQVRDDFGCTNDYLQCCEEMSQILWQHMEAGFTEFNDQLLCSTHFYTILTLFDGNKYYLEKVLKLIQTELGLKEKGKEASKKMYQSISLVYGIFQSSILQQKSDDPIMISILGKIFSLLTLLAYEYSQYTFITFKIMTFYKKVAGTSLQHIIFNKTHNFKLLNVINHNWENPITGVRGLNKIIFHNLLSTVDEVTFAVIEQQLNRFYWNKAKYLMLAEIIEQYQSNIRPLEKFDLLGGLVYSLKKDGLVSAGADMYVAMLKKITNEEEWCAIFLSSIIEIVKDSSIKPIENFKNYWCLNTFKKIPSLSQTIFDEIMKIDTGDHKLYSCLSIVQQSNRLGLLGNCMNSCDSVRQLVTYNIDHNVDCVRMTSFDIMCGLHRKGLPREEDFDLILKFLDHNVNSDCSILRISMIKSLKNFLMQLHITFINNTWNNDDNDINNLLKFCKNLQMFIVWSLDIDGNYQRKVATIQITQVMLNCFKEIPRKKQKKEKQLHSTLMDFMKSRNQWILSNKEFILKLIGLLKDPSDDVRDHVKDVLLYNYCEQLCNSDLIIYLTEEALLCIKSKFFYQITCGHTIFKLIANILLTHDNSNYQFKAVEDIFNFAYNELKSESNTETNIIKAIVGGKQQHSYLSILHCIFDVSLEKSHKLNVSMDIIDSLIEVLKSISNQFTWEQEASVSSDFSKMSDMVEKIITNSEYKISSPINDTNISGLHQIVLNCLWLNVKASCELCAILIKYFKNDAHIDLCEKCLNIICNVLETSRHKGAIEAGGAALGQAIQQLTSLQDNSLNSPLPMLLLKKKLNQLVLETNNMASVTRRGAGLSIMIHRIVSSDMKKGKPLFHCFMKTLLDTCNKLPESCNYESEDSISNEKDLPKAIYIHFLTKIVTDSSLASDMMFYSGELAKLGFDNLSSSCWQIRNAALQLYGSLIPKLIGQKKNSCVSEEVRATVAVEEFCTHSPKLWEYIEEQLNLTTQSCGDIIQCHNNLVPILSVLANLAPIYTFTNELEYSKQLLQSLIALLGSPIYVVRQLTSKCILNIYSFEVILGVLLNATCKAENSFHGTLVLLNQFNKEYSLKVTEDKVTTLRDRFKVLTDTKSSYLSKECFEKTFPECIHLNEEVIKETLSKLQENINAPGLFVWANFRIQLYLKNCLWKEIPQIILLISECSDFEVYLEILCNKLQIDNSIEKEIMINLCNILYVLGFKKNSPMIWRLLYKISLLTHFFYNQLDTSLIHQYLLDNKELYSIRYIIPFAARLFKDNAKEELLLLSNIIFNLCLPELDVDMRLIAAMAINDLAYKFMSTSDSTKINIIKSVILLLQDEDEDVRKLSVHFYRIINMEDKSFHPYICWRMILTKQFLNNVFNEPQTAIQSICNDLLEIIKSITMSNDDEYNPFANDSKNIYLEPNLLKKVLFDLQTD